MRYLCIVENATGNTLTYAIWSLRSVPMISVASSQLLEAKPFPFHTVKMLYDMKSLGPLNYDDKRTLKGYIVTNHDLQPLTHVPAYVRGRLGPLAHDAPGAGPDGFAWILTLNPNCEISESSISRIRAFVGEPKAPYTWFPLVSPEQVATADATCGCAIS